MSDVGDDYRALRELRAEERKRNLESASKDGWHLHTKYHWSRTLNGKRLDYWPSKNKWQYANKVMCGDVVAFINKRTVQQVP